MENIVSEVLGSSRERLGECVLIFFVRRDRREVEVQCAICGEARKDVEHIIGCRRLVEGYAEGAVGPLCCFPGSV